MSGNIQQAINEINRLVSEGMAYVYIGPNARVKTEGETQFYVTFNLKRVTGSSPSSLASPLKELLEGVEGVVSIAGKGRQFGIWVKNESEIKGILEGKAAERTAQNATNAILQ